MAIRNREGLVGHGSTDRDRRAREIALEVLEKVLLWADPKRAVLESVKVKDNDLVVKGSKFSLDDFENIYVVGVGKAGGGLAEAVEDLLGDRISLGFVNIPEGTKGRYRTSCIELNEATHPIPNENGVRGSKRILEIARGAGENDLVIILISGGGSALMPLPLEGLSLEDLQRVTKALLRSGAVINEINAVRKHLSGIKGGRLAMACCPATVVSLIFSDVVGDPLDVIASGPTVMDPSTFDDAIRILEKYGLGEEFPVIMEHLRCGSEGGISESLKSGDEALSCVHNFLICTNEIVIQNVVRDISGRFDCEVFSTSLEGEARDVGVMLADKIMGRRSVGPLSRPLVILAGGETTVTVHGNGLGGRNQELVLGALSKLRGDGVVVASMGTDGVDGTSDAAGALIDGSSFKRAESLNLSPEVFLANNDSYTFFSSLEDTILTGPSGTNVNDISVLVVV